MIADKRRRFSMWPDDIRNAVKKQQYHEVRFKVQRQIREMENNWWVQKAQEIQALSDSDNSKDFFAATNKINGPSSLGVRLVAGKDLTAIRDRWKEHFCELLNQTPMVNNDAITNLPQLSVKSHLDGPLTLEEITTAIGAMKKGKAAGPDGIPTEV